MGGIVNSLKQALPSELRFALKRQAQSLRRVFGGDGTQFGEATVLSKLIKPDFPPWLVDVGAYDGVVQSNSLPFVRQGWHGLLVEPHPRIFSMLERTHGGNQRVRCVNKAVAAERGVATFFLGDGGDTSMTSTLCTDDNELLNARRTGQSIEVQTDTLTNLLAEAGFPRDIGFLSVDAEGMDYEVLSALDFGRFQPRIVVSEDYPLNVEKHNRKYRLLLDNGYALYTMSGCNSVWIRNEWLAHCVQ